MSAAVEELVKRAKRVADHLDVVGNNQFVGGYLRRIAEAVEAELAATPQQQHEQALARGLAEDGEQGIIR